MVASSSQETAGVVAAEVVPERVDCAGFVPDAAGVEDRAAELQCRPDINDPVGLEGAIEDIQCCVGMTVAVNGGA